MDLITIRDMETDCIIGTLPEERLKPQRLVMNVELETDLARAGTTDNLADTVNYSELRHRILGHVQSSECLLIERVAEEIAGICLEDELVSAVTVSVDKPAALEEARSVAVTIHRTGNR